MLIASGAVATEEWRACVGFEGLYEVSSEGRVRSLDRMIPYANGAARPMKGRMLKPGVASNGYPTVAICKGNSRTIHSLVADAFLGPCPAGQEILHRDETRSNPRRDNLRYGTRSENIMQAVESGQWFSPRRLASAAARRAS